MQAKSKLIQVIATFNYYLTLCLSVVFVEAVELICVFQASEKHYKTIEK